LVGGALLWGTGVACGQGDALRFNGSSSYVQVPHNTSLNAYPLTVTAWFRTTNAGAVLQGLVSKYADNSGNGWALGVQSGRVRGFYYRNNSLSDVAVDATPAATVADGFWHHAALVVDGTGGKVYVDGVLGAQASWSGATGAPTSAQPLQIGQYSTYPPYPAFDGDIDEVTLWNRALSSTELNYVKHRNLTGTEDGLLALWHFDEGSGATASDATSDGYDGTLVNNPLWVVSSAPLVFNNVAGNALKFSGGADYVSVAHDPALNSYPFTAMAWFRTANGASVVQGIVSKYADGSGNGWTLVVQNGHLRGFYYRGSFAAVAIDATSAAVVADGSWHHAALVVGSTGGILYLDGAVAGQASWSGAAGGTTSTEPLQIGQYSANPPYPAFLGDIDEVSVWNVALSSAQIASYKNAALQGSETGLVALWRLNEGTGTTANDLTSNGHTGTLINSPAWTGSTAFLGDGTSAIHTTVGALSWTRQFAVQTIPAQRGFAGRAPVWVRRLDDFGAPGANTSVAVMLQSALQSTLLGAPLPLVNNNTQLTVTLGPFNAATPQVSAGGVIESPAIDVEPQAGIQIDSVNDTLALGVTESYSANNGPVVTGETTTLAPVPLLHFDGNLVFGTIPTTFSSIANSPTRGSLGGGGVNTQLAVNNNSGTLVSNPAYHYGNGTTLNVVLLSNGDAQAPPTTIALQGPVPDLQCIQNVCFLRTNVTLSTGSGLSGQLWLQLPLGLSIGSGTNNRLTTNQVPFANIALDANLIPQSSQLVLGGPLFAVEETKPFWIEAPSLTWSVSAGQILIPNPTAIHFVRQHEDDALSSQTGLIEPDATNRVSNDGYYRNAGSPGPVTFNADSNGVAQMSMQLALNPPELRPHFPYAGRAAGTQIPTTGGGQLAIAGDLIDSLNSYLPLSGPVPVMYARDCGDTNCSSVTIDPAVLAFTADGSQLGFTADGGLLAYGSVPPTNLTWGYAGNGNYAQRTSDVQDGAYEMAGTFLRYDQNVLGASNGPAVLLLSGFGDASNPAYLERPGQDSYGDGLANYAGLNFRAPAQGWSYVAGQDTGWYLLTSRCKYYARSGGISGIQETDNFPPNLTLYGYPFMFTSYSLSYLDSDNWESRTDGSLTLPVPAGFTQEFSRMKFVCRGDLDSAQVPATSGVKHMVYWNTDITPQSINFQPTNEDVCAGANRFLVLGVETHLPFIPEGFHALLGFKANGNLLTAADGGQVDSRFAVPGRLSLQGPGTSTFPLATAGDAYFNNWETAGRPDNGFFNIVGKLRTPFFADSKVHLHVTPTGPTTGQIDIMGGWPDADGNGDNLGWNDGANNYFNTAKFDQHQDGFPQAAGVGGYRNSSTTQFHPRVQRDWIDVAKFDYSLEWNSPLREFAGFAPATVILPVIDVNSDLKELSPGKVDFDFAQDITIQLPRLKVLDFANDAFNELNGPILTVSNAVRQELGSLLDTSGLTSGFRSLQSALREDASTFFRPILGVGFSNIVNELYTQLAALPQNDQAAFLNGAYATVINASGDLTAAVQGINGAANTANSVVGQVNQTLLDVDNTLGLYLSILGKDAQGNRHVVRAIVEKLVQDQGQELGFLEDLTDDLVNGLLQDVEPTLAQVESDLQDLRSQVDELQGQIASGTGDFTAALQNAANDAMAAQQFVQTAAINLTNMLGVAVTSAGDYFTADPAAAQDAIRERLIVTFLGSGFPADYQQSFKQFLTDDNFVLDQLLNVLFDQINRSIRDGLLSPDQGQDGTFQALKGVGQMSQSLLSAKIRGSPTFEGDSLRQIHLDSDIQMNLPDQMNFHAYMDIRELTSQSVALDCVPAGAPAAEVTLGAKEIPLSWAGVNDSGTPLTLSVEGRWTLQSGSVLGIGGLLDIKGEIGFEGCSLKEIGAQFAVGALENYFAAKGAGTLNILGIPVDVQAGIFAGKACTLDPLNWVDPNAGKILNDPLGFTGIYLQYGGGLSLSEILFDTSSCFLDIEAHESTAVFYEGGPRSGKLGFSQSYSLGLRLACLIEGSADVTLGAAASFTPPSSYEVDLTGAAQVCGKLGACPFCVSGCKGITIRGSVKNGGVDYSIDY